MINYSISLRHWRRLEGEMGRFNFPTACSMVRNLPVKISPIHILKNVTLSMKYSIKIYNPLFVLIKINLMCEEYFTFLLAYQHHKAYCSNTYSCKKLLLLRKRILACAS